MKKKKTNYFRRLIDENDPASVKRFTILIALGLYTLTNLMALFISRAFVNAQILSTFVEFNFYIIGVGIFGLAIDKVADILLERAKASAAAQILTPQPTVTKVDNVQGDVNGPQGPQVGDDVFEEDEDLKNIKTNLKKSLKQKE